jgi:hypothetical protein
MLERLPSKDLPEWFRYPETLVELLDKETIDFGPWQLLHGESLLLRHNGLKKRFPQLTLVPFARRFDCDDVACFDVSIQHLPLKALIIHDFCSPGWEQRGEYASFEDWLEAAKLEAEEWD